jgi:hypothetical protein
VGPSLEINHQPIVGRLLNPALELHDGKGALIFSNDDWPQSPQRAQVKATGLAPKDSREAAIIATLPEGNYTAVIRGKNNTSGIALGEIYDLSPGTTSRLINLSARAVVLTGDNVLIDGLIVGGKTAKDVVIRAIGPGLHSRGVSGELHDPTLELYDGSGTLLRKNDNWRDAFNHDQIQSKGFAPTDNRESAILIKLAPGNYTTIVRGAGGTTGIALAEFYILN